jgi:hypothetical protein
MNCACNSNTSCPSAWILRTHQWALPHASRATRPAGRCARNAIKSSRPNFRFAISPVWALTQYNWSVSSGALLHHRPLRTGRAGHPASGSSHSSAPWCGTEQLDGTFRGSTAGEVSCPRPIKWISQAPDLDVSRNRDCHCAEEPKPAGTAPSRTLRSKVPGPVCICPEVPVLHPPCSFHGMTTHCPFPEQLPDVRVYR